jgi:hypothetical protein
VGLWDARALGLGGWSLSTQHAYDASSQTLLLGDGRQRRAEALPPVITTVAGNGDTSFSGDGGPATAASLNVPNSVALGPDGSLYIADMGSHRIRRVGPNGIITTVAGNGASGFGGDGGPAVAASLSFPTSVAMGPDGSLFISVTARIRRLRPDGIITIVAGNGRTFGEVVDGGPATATSITPWDVAVGPDASLFFADASDRIRCVRAALPDVSVLNVFLPAEASREVYVFNSNGRHLKTLHALTGSVRYQFGYGANGYLTSMMDGSGNVTTIERSGAVPTAIVAPDGQRTALTVSADG